MKRQEISHCVCSICHSLRRSQAKTLSVLVPAAMTLARASLAQLGRALAGQSPVATKHCIKRVDRFVGNPRIEPTEAMRGLVQWLAQPRKKLLVSLDWVDIRHFQCLVLAARLRGRALPLLWAVYQYEDVYRSQNNLEYGLLRAFRTMIPPSVAVTVLADRGFGRTEMARVCQALTFHYVIRIRPTAWVRSTRFTGRLTAYPIQRGQRHLLRHVWYRKARPVRQQVAVVWLRDQAEPWYLMTDEDHLKASVLSKVFARRMSIEEYFRDTKSKRNGFALRLVQIHDSQRLSRFLLILAWAYILLVTVGLYALTHLRPAQWCSNNRPGECSLFTIGKVMQASPLPTCQYLLRRLKHELLKQNWG
jgi:hypothetical protein